MVRNTYIRYLTRLKFTVSKREKRYRKYTFSIATRENIALETRFKVERSSERMARPDVRRARNWP